MDIVHQNPHFLSLSKAKMNIGFLNFGAHLIFFLQYINNEYFYLMDIKFEIETIFSPDPDQHF